MKPLVANSAAPFVRAGAELLADRLDAGNVERIIGLKFPANLIQHPDVIIRLLHQFRPAYGTPPVGWPDDASCEPAASAVRAADRRAFAGARRLYAISASVADGLQQARTRSSRPGGTRPRCQAALPPEHRPECTSPAARPAPEQTVVDAVTNLAFELFDLT